MRETFPIKTWNLLFFNHPQMVGVKDKDERNPAPIIACPRPYDPSTGNFHPGCKYVNFLPSIHLFSSFELELDGLRFRATTRNGRPVAPTKL